MGISRKIGLGLLGIAWIALGVASVGVILSPTYSCGGEPLAAGEVTTLVALGVAGVTAFVALGIALDSLLVVGIVSATFVAGGGVFWWLTQHSGGGCF